MGKYTFTWEHEAHDVFVTGSFDNWRKSIKLEKEGGVFKKTVELPKTKHQYKFVVNGSWVTNESSPKEDDGSGNYNNILAPADITDDEPVNTLSSAAPESSTAALAGAVPKENQTKKDKKKDKKKAKKNAKQDELVNTFSSAAPGSSTAALAGAVPKENEIQNKNLATPAAEDLPGAFPLTPPVETPSNEPKAFSINPIPATAGPGNPVSLAPGEKVPEPSTFTSNTVESTVKHDKEPEEATVSVAPIPATAGAGNPVQLAPGEKVPHPSTFTANTVDSTVKTDAASYEKADTQPPQLPVPIFTPEAEREAQGGMFSLPPLAGSVVPESSLPMGVDAKVEQDTGIHIQSAAPTSTTAALAAQVPKEPRADVPEVVKESQQEAGFKPEASANSEAVEEKKELEQELKEKVPEEPATSTNEKSATQQATEAASAGAEGAKKAGEIAAAGAVGAAGAFAAATYAAKDKAAETLNLNGQTATPASGVPEVVAESQEEAHVSPEAAANPEAVREKKEVESELLSSIGKGSQAATAADAVPAVVAESQMQAHVSPEAAANPEAVEEKKEVESELLHSVGKADQTATPAAAVPAVVAESQKEAHVSPEAAANPEAVEEKKVVESELLQTGHKAEEQAAASDVPAVVAESQKEAHASPEAAANAEAVEEKKAVESELLKEVKPVTEAAEPAPTVTAATSATVPGLSDEALSDEKPLKSSSEPNALNVPTLNAPADEPALPATAQKVVDSRDVSPMSKQPTTDQQTEPVVTTGVESSTTAEKSTPETPKKENAPSSTEPPKSVGSDAGKKKKRLSFFGKLKEKFSSSK